MNLKRNKKSELDLADSLLDVVMLTMREVRSRFREKDFDISLPQFRILAVLHEGPKTNKELADSICLSVATMSRMVQALTKRKLVLRYASEVDRRASRLQLSAEGQQMLVQTRAKLQKGMAEAFREFSATEREVVHSALALLLATLG